MKKVIGLFTILSFAVASVAGAAGQVINLDGVTDSVFTNIRTLNRALNVNNNAFTLINSKLEIEGDSGGNNQVAGGDLQGVINTGNVNIVGEESYDTNGLDVVINENCDCVGGDDQVLNGTYVNDTVATNSEVANEAENFNSGTYAELNLDTEVEAETGENNQVAGDDLGSGYDNPSVINAGAPNITFSRITVPNLTRITINRN